MQNHGFCLVLSGPKEASICSANGPALKLRDSGLWPSVTPPLAVNTHGRLMRPFRISSSISGFMGMTFRARPAALPTGTGTVFAVAPKDLGCLYGRPSDG